MWRRDRKVLADHHCSCAKRVAKVASLKTPKRRASRALLGITAALVGLRLVGDVADLAKSFGAADVEARASAMEAIAIDVAIVTSVLVLALVLFLPSAVRLKAVAKLRPGALLVTARSNAEFRQLTNSDAHESTESRRPRLWATFAVSVNRDALEIWSGSWRPKSLASYLHGSIARLELTTMESGPRQLSAVRLTLHDGRSARFVLSAPSLLGAFPASPDLTQKFILDVQELAGASPRQPHG